MARRTVGKPLDEHVGAIANTAKVAKELAYEIVDLKYESGRDPDIVIKNPQNGRIVWVEVEVRFQKQKQTADKYRRRLKELERNDEDVILLITGASCDELIKWTSQGKVVIPKGKYGKRVFSSTSYYDINEIRAVLLRCLGSG